MPKSWRYMQKTSGRLAVALGFRWGYTIPVLLSNNATTKPLSRLGAVQYITEHKKIFNTKIHHNNSPQKIPPKEYKSFGWYFFVCLS